MTENERPVPAKQRWWRRKGVRVAMVVIGTALVILAKFSLAEKREEQRAASEAKHEITSFAVGDCVTIGSGTPEKGNDIQRGPCTTDPSYTVGVVMETDQPCPNQNYIGYKWTVGDTDTVGRLCLVENLAVGHCYHPQPGTDLLEQLDCSVSDDKTYKVVHRIDSDSAGQCPAETNAYNYPAPPRTYCLGPAQ